MSQMLTTCIMCGEFPALVCVIIVRHAWNQASLSGGPALQFSCFQGDLLGPYRTGL